MKDRCMLYEESVVEAMNQVENLSEPVTKEKSVAMGVSMEASKACRSSVGVCCSSYNSDGATP